jgi:hypothetical protein
MPQHNYKCACSDCLEVVIYNERAALTSVRNCHDAAQRTRIVVLAEALLIERAAVTAATEDAR